MPLALFDISALPGVQVQIDAARAAVDEVIGHRALRRHGAEIALESSLRGARSSAALEGVDVDLEFLRSGHLRLDHPGRPTAQAALRVAQEIPLLETTWRRSPVQALARMHMVAAADLVEQIGEDSIGRPRTSPAQEGHLPGSRAVAAADVAPRLMALNSLLLDDRETSAVVVAAVVHGELMALQPFGTRDGLVARGAERLVLRTRGLDPRGLVVVEAGHLAVGRQQYRRLLAGFAKGGDEGLAAWVMHCAQAIRTGSATIETVCQSLTD